MTDDNKTVAYSITGDNGTFLINIPEDKTPAVVSIRYMGYKNKTFPYSEFKNGMTITLTEEGFRLREIKIRPQRIKNSGDTITYNVGMFKQLQDRNIADVIAKMPGLEVKDNGKIEYQGKPISKFYIEGLDLMGAQYGVANKNISADKVKSVQVLENHQTVKSLRGVKFSDHAALNIVLRDDAKAVWCGSADIGLGYGDELLYDCRLMAMRFNKRFQTLMMYKDNNTGNDIGNEVLDLATLLNGKTGNETGILSMMVGETPNLAPERYTFNHSHLFAGNWLWKTGKDSELRVQGNGYIDKEAMSSYRQTTYLTLAGLPIVVEDQSVDNSRSEWKAEANYQYNGDKTFIKNNVRGYVDFNESAGTIFCNDARTDLSVKPRKRYVVEDFQLSHTTARGNVYSINSYITYNHLPGQLLTINNMSERLNLDFFSMDNTLEYKLKLGRQYFNNTVGMSYDNQKIGVEADDAEEQSSRYQLSQLYWEPSTAIRFGRHHIDLAVKFTGARQSYRQSLSNHLWIDESLYWNWKSSVVSEFSANISYRNSPLMGKEIYDTPVFTDYRTQRTNRGTTDVQHVFTVTAAYKYSNPIRGLFLNIRPLFTRTSGNILYTSGINGNIYSLTATDRDYAMETMGVTGRISKSTSWARLNVGVNASYNITDYCLLIADIINDARMTTAKVSVDYSLNPLRQLSFDGATGMTVHRQQNLTQHDLSSGSTTQWQHYLNMHIFPVEKWMISLKNELFHSSEHSYGTSYFCDISIGYKTKRWELSLNANNLLGTSRFEQRVLGNTVETYSITRLRPREFVVKGALSF